MSIRKAATAARVSLSYRCYDWLPSKIRETYKMSKGVNKCLCSESGAGLDSQAGDKMY